MNISDFVFYLILLFLFLKLIEIIRSMIWVVILGELFVKEILPHMQLLTTKKLYVFVQKYNYLTWPGNTPFTYFFRWLYSKKIFRPIIAILFRHPTLVLLLSILTFSLDDTNYLILSSMFLLVSIWIEPLNRLLHRYMLGTIDNYLVAFSLRVIDDKLIFPVSPRLFLRRFILLFMALFFVTVVGYAAIYSVLASGVLDGNGLTNLECQYKNPLWVQCMYFSVATLCTVGFGDITATGPIAQFVVMTEMLLGFVLLVMLLSAFSVSSGKTEDF